MTGPRAGTLLVQAASSQLKRWSVGPTEKKTVASAALLVVVLAFYLLVATTLGLLAGAVARRLAPRGRLAAGIRIGIPVFLGALGLVMAGGIAFGTAARPDA